MNLSNDGVDSVVIYTPAEVEALPPSDAITSTNLEDAKRWAGIQIRELGERVDWDCDDIPNLEEICDNGILGLFSDPPCP